MPSLLTRVCALPPVRLSLLALAALAAACGGGGGGSDTAPGGGSSNVAVQFTAPVAEEVYTAGVPLAMTARVTVNGVDADDGTPVQFSAGTSATATASTKTGLASVALTSAATGAQQLQASATVAGGSATAVRTVYFRPAPAPLEVLVPAYFVATGAGATAWASMTAEAAANPTVKVTAILNPANGIFTQADTAMAQAATAFTAAGGKVVGYVYTNYGTGNRSLADIKANIDNYFTHYGRGVISGIFLDEMAATANRVDFYREIYAYIKSKDATLRVIGNPGAVPVAGYADVADVLTVFEDKRSAFASYEPRTTEKQWLYTRANSTQAALVHNAADCATMQSAVQAAATAHDNMGLIYVTHREYEPATGVGNPWAGLPSYWSTLVQTVRNVNAQQALPACP